MGIFNHSIKKILMKKILIFILLSSCINSQETEKNNSYDDLVILYEDWRLFEEPDLIN